MVFHTIIETQIVFEQLLAFVAGQLAIVGQLRREAYCWVQFALKDESPQSCLRHAQSVETPTMSSVMQTCQNNLGLNLCVVPPTSHVVAISEFGLVRSCKERGKARHH